MRSKRRLWPGVAAVLLSGASPAAAQVPRLISTADLAALADSASVRLLDTRQSWVGYLQNHLPNAAWLNIETLRAQDGDLPFQLLPAQHYAELFHRLGVDRSRPVVVYSAGDQLDIDATFVCWLLASAGARSVYLLDGGYAKWELENRPLSQRYPLRGSMSGGFLPKQFRPPVASLAEVWAAAKGSGALLVDARPAEQFAGSAGAQLRRGHIPGAVNHPWKDNLEKRDLLLVWKPVEDLRSAYLSQGITPDRDIIVYCNSSTEASHILFALKYLLGYPRVRIYLGSWTQWAAQEELPVEMGEGRNAE